MKILLFGKNGQVGWELQRSLAPLGELVALGRDDVGGDYAHLDGIRDAVRRFGPDVIVNASAHTAVDRAESEPELARQLNTLAPAVLAEEAKLRKAWLVHYSTDYVFGGGGHTPWLETDAVSPLSVYGQTKAEGEDFVRASGCKHLIFRTSWVYSTRGGNFAKTMLRLAQERTSLSVVNDQFGTPTGADLLADVSAHVIRFVQREPNVAGLYHLVAGGVTSWYEYACFVLEYAKDRGLPLKVNSQGVQAVATDAFPTRAKRPNNSRLNTQKLQSTFGLTLPHWQIGVARMLTEYLEK